MTNSNKFICKQCNRYFKSPSILPCGDTICKKHVINDKIRCPNCNQEHIIPEQGFPINKAILEMMADGTYLDIIFVRILLIKIVFNKFKFIKDNF
jgi:hypothetical protein